MFQPLQLIHKEKLKDTLQKKIAEKNDIPLNVVEEVLSFTFSETKKAFKIHTEVEISGFGKFRVVPKRLKWRLESTEKRIQKTKEDIEKETNERKLILLKDKLRIITEDYEYLKSVH